VRHEERPEGDRSADQGRRHRHESGGIDFSSAPRAATAYFACVNANGGINGRPVSLDVRDDALNPQKAAEFAAKFASDPSVVAMVGDATFVGCGVGNDQYQKANLFDIDAVGVPRQCFESSNIAPVNAGPRISGIAAAQWAVEHEGAKAVAQNGNNTPNTGDWTQAGVDAYLRSKGLTPGKEVLHDPGIKDANSILLDLMTSKPDAIVLVDPVPDDITMLKAAQPLGLKSRTKFYCATPCYDRQFPGQVGSYWDGFVTNAELEYLDSKNPDNQLWLKVMDAYGQSADPRDSFSQAGFLSAKILSDTLLKLPADQLTRDSVSRAIVGIKSYQTDLLCGSWYFGQASRHNANHATRFAKLQNGAYVPTGGCVQTADPDIAPILALEKSQGLTG